MNELVNEVGRLGKASIFYTKRKQRFDIYANKGIVPIVDDYNGDALSKMQQEVKRSIDNIKINFFTNDAPRRTITTKLRVK